MADIINLKEFVAKRIRYLRLKNNMTQEYLAEQAGLGFNYIYRLENKQLNLKLETIEKIIKALNIDIETFFNTSDSSKSLNLTLLMEDIENLPQEKREPVIEALRILIKQFKS